MNIPVTDVVPTYVREDQKIIPVLMHLQPNAVQLVVTVKAALPAVPHIPVLMLKLRNVVPAITVTILAIMVPNRYLAVQTMFQPGFLQPNAGPAVMNANIIPIVALLRQIVLMVAVLIIHVIYVCLANLLPQIHHLILVMSRLVMSRLVITRLPMILRRQIRQIIMNRILQIIMNRKILALRNLMKQDVLMDLKRVLMDVQELVTAVLPNPPRKKLLVSRTGQMKGLVRRTHIHSRLQITVEICMRLVVVWLVIHLVIRH